MRESVYEAKLVKKLQRMYPGCVILKNDSSYLQGVPDRLILHESFWAMLEVKESEKSSYRPNQEYYLRKFDEMSFAATIYPSNELEVLNALQRAFQSGRSARLSQSQ